MYGHTCQHLFLRIPHAVAVAVLPDFAAQFTQPHNACVDLGQRLAAGDGQRSCCRYAVRAGLNAALCYAALRSGECAVLFMRRKAHAVASGRHAFKDIASVFFGAHRRDDRVGGIQQFNRRIHAVAFFLAKAGVGVVVIIDHAGHRAGEHRADIHSHAALPHRQGEGLAPAAGNRALRHTADRIIRRRSIHFFGCPPLSGELIRDHIFSRADACKGHVAFRVRLIGDGFGVFAGFKADQRHADALKARLIRSLLPVNLRILKYVDHQLCQNGHARVDRFKVFARRQFKALCAAALRNRAIDCGILAESGKRPVAVQLEQHAVCTRQQILEAIAARFIGYGFGNAVRMPVLCPEQRDAHARKRLRPAVDAAVSVVVDAHPAADLRGAADRQLTKVDCIALPDADMVHDGAVLRLFAKVRRRQIQPYLVFARKDAREAVAAQIIGQRHGRFILAFAEQLDIQSAEAFQRAVRHQFLHRAHHASRVDAARVDDIIRMVAVDHQCIAHAVAHIANSALHMVGVKFTAGENHVFARAKLHLIFTAGQGREFIASVRARPAGCNGFAGLGKQRNRQARIACRFVRFHQAIGIAVHKRNAADLSVYPRRHRHKRAASLHRETILMLGDAVHGLLFLAECRRIAQASGKLNLRLQGRFPFRVHADIQGDLSRRKAARGDFFAGLRVQVSDADRVDVILNIRQADSGRPGQHIRHNGGRRTPAAPCQAVFNPRTIASALRIRRAG